MLWVTNIKEYIMTLPADKAAKLKKLETELMGMQQEQFDYYFFAVDSNSSGIDAVIFK